MYTIELANPWQVALESGFLKKSSFGKQIHWFLVDRRQIRLISLSCFKKYLGSCERGLKIT